MIIGIDIGLNGALCVLVRGETPVVLDLPTVEISRTRMVKRRLDARELMKILHQIGCGSGCVAVIEDVHTVPGRMNSPQTQGSLMHSRGIVEAVLELAGAQVRAIEPATWKRRYGLTGEAKSASLETARRLYPTLAIELKRQKDHNRAESVLLAHYGAMDFK